MAGGEAVMRMNVANAHERELRAGVRHRSTAPQWRSVHSGSPASWSARLYGRLAWRGRLVMVKRVCPLSEYGTPKVVAIAAPSIRC